MSRGTNQKFKFTYLMKIMLAKTDDEHALTMPQIMEELEKYDVTAERKSIYADFQDMTDKFGIEIIKEQIGRETYYHVGSREFELAEVKLLIDAIQSSKFITQTKSRELINKIKSNVSEHQAKQLQRQVYINDRVKAMNESVYYNVDDIHTAIYQNKKIRFKYYKWDVSKKLVPRHNGDWFVVSPWALTWDDENYYLVAFDDLNHQVKHYRVDKMMRISIEDEKRDGKEEFKNFDMAEYSKSTFGMYQGKKTTVKIVFADYMCGVFIDRFGKDISIRSVDEKQFALSIISDGKKNDEHFLVNRNYEYALYNEEDEIDIIIKVPRKYKSYIATLANYIWLDSDVNSLLHNRPVYEKIRIIESIIAEKGIDAVIPGLRSQQHYACVKSVFYDASKYPEKKLHESKKKSERKKLLSDYYKNNFEEEFSQLIYMLSSENRIFEVYMGYMLKLHGFLLTDEKDKYSNESSFDYNLEVTVDGNKKKMIVSYEVLNPFYAGDSEDSNQYSKLLDGYEKLFSNIFGEKFCIESSNDYGGSDDESITFTACISDMDGIRRVMSNIRAFETELEIAIL